MKKLNILITVFFLLSTSLVFAETQTDYYNEGTTGAYGSLDTNPFVLVVDTLSNNNHIIEPVIYDIDNDGDEELITVNGNSINIYHINTSNNKFNLIDSYNNGEALLTKFQVLNITGTPTIYYVTQNDFHKLTYNGTDFVHNNTVVSMSATDGGFGCGEWNGDTDEVFCFYNTWDGTTGANAEMELHRINWTDGVANRTNEVNQKACSSAGTRFFNNQKRELQGVVLGDTNDDSKNEAYFSWGAYCPGGGYNDNLVILTQIDQSFNVAEVEIPLCSAGLNQNSPYPITKPLIKDIDGGDDDILIGCMSGSGDNYKVYSYDTNLILTDDFPEVGNVESTIVSNLFLLDCFIDTGIEDVGILGYDEDENELGMLCLNNKPTGISDSTREFTPFTVSNATVNSSIVYTANMGYASSSSLFTPFGILGVQATESILLSEGTLSTLFDNNKDGISIPVSLSNNPMDLLVVTDTNIWYYDDNFENSNPEISIDVNPCNTVCTNQTGLVTITATDVDLDNVRVKLIAYEGEANEQDTGWSSYLASGASIQLSYQANQSTTGSTLKVYAEDNTNESEGNSSLEWNIIVSSGSGCYVQGETVCSSTTVASTVSDAEELAENIQTTNEAIGDSLADIPIFGTSFSNNSINWMAILALFATLVLSIGVFMRTKSFGATGLASILLVFIFTLFGWIPTFYLIIFGILATVAGIIAISRTFTGG